MFSDTLPEVSLPEVSSEWSKIMNILDSFNTYSDLETYVLSLNEEYTKAVKCVVQKIRKGRHQIDHVARNLYMHTDSQVNVVPVGMATVVHIVSALQLLEMIPSRCR